MNLKNKIIALTALVVVPFSYCILDNIKENSIRNEQLRTMHSQCTKLYQSADKNENRVLELNESVELYKVLGIHKDGEILVKNYTPSELISKLLYEEGFSFPLKENNKVRSRVIRRLDNALLTSGN